MFRSLNYSLTTALLIATALEAGSALGVPVPEARNGQEVCQTAVLDNGYTIRYSRREVIGSSTRLWVCEDQSAGYVQIPTEQIVRFEREDSAVPATPRSTSALETTTAAVPPAEESIEKLIANAAARHQIDPDFLASLVRAESNFNPKAVSPKGAQGLMQLMPHTANSLGVLDILDPAANIEGGTRYLRQLLGQYSGDAVKALAAYNAGPQRVQQYGGMPPYRETRAYVTRVINDFNRKKLEQQAKSRPAHK
jgi:soluble lytic murein transglycosylase-like protein